MATMSDFSGYLGRAANHIEDKAKRIVRDTLRKAKKSAEDHTSGSLDASDLAEMDHPFAKRHGTPKLNPNELNIREGDLHAGWRTDGPRIADQMITGTLRNIDPKFEEYLEPGTEFMFARDPLALVEEDIEPYFYEKMEFLMLMIAMGKEV